MSIAAPPKSTTKIAEEPVSGKRPRLVGIVPFFAWQLAAFLIVELLLFFAGIGEEEIFKFDPELGTKHMSNKRVTWRSEGYSQGYLNDDGMREPNLTIDKPPGTYRIALLGDSMVEAFQVPLEETFGQLVENRLNTRAGTKVQVLNFGCSGYSTVQQFLQFKKQVLKYKPDTVIACYSSRDIFENWSPPDEIARNVRPVALQLPGQQLAIETYYVRRWMNSPRARMLQGLEWLREHSRIWGLAAIVDFDLSLHNPAYRAVARFFTEPKGELRKLRASLAVLWPRPCSALPISGRASVGLQSPAAVATLEQKRQDAYTPGSAVDRAAVKVGRSADSKLASASSQSAGAQRGDHHVFNAILADTLASLLSEMKQECEKSGCRLVVQALPYRSTLLPLAGAATGYSGLDYTGERQILSRSCNQLNIPLIDSQTPAESLSTQGRQALFYGHHLTPQGHKFVAESMCEFLRQQLTIAPNI